MACNNDSIIQGSGSSDSSSSAPVTLNSLKYDVFVSFRGKDTRYNFTDNLFASFQRKGIFAFRDDTKLKKGESIAPKLLDAIEASQIFVVVFSNNYAYSTWCLRELEYILECVQVSRKRVLPVFYDVDPSEVRKQGGSYADAFSKHEERCGQDSDKLQRWREALTQVANLSGWDLRHKPQSIEIEKIVEEIINTLGHKVSSLPNDIVGMHVPLEKLERHLFFESVDDVRVIGICGMHGVGKTTLATLLYDRISHRFDACCFIDDLSKIYRDDGPIGVQKLILHQTLGNEHLIQICNLYDGGNLMRNRLHHVKLLIILDNVDHIEQLEKLAVNRKWLAVGSRIIIVSRDAHIMYKYGADVVYKVPFLNQTDSLQLFCQEALRHDNIMSDYKELANDILKYVSGLPLAIKVVGSLLLGRDISEWRSAFARLRESPNKDIMDVFQFSFDGLEEMEKEIFLDIACFFNGNDKEYVKTVLDCCGFHSEIGLRVLVDKSLISISDKNVIEMHGLLEELGRKTIQQKQPRKWSRLWLCEHFSEVISKNMENKVEAVVLRYKYGETKILMAEALSKMSNLRLLIIVEVNVRGNLTYLSNELRYVKWDSYPFEHLPSSFQPSLLVELILAYSKIIVWEGKKYLPSLRTLDLKRSDQLMKVSDFGKFQNLERLNLKGCYNLVEIDPSSGVPKKLVYLNLDGCASLITIPNNIFTRNSLKYLNLFSCSKLFDTKVESRSSSFSILSRIKLPLRSGVSQTDQHPIPKCLPCLSLPCLRELVITYCGLSEIPDAIGSLHSLERFFLGRNSFVTLPSFRKLSKLSCLHLMHCLDLKALPELPSAVTIEQDDVFSDTRIAGLYVFDCPKLGDKEMCRRDVFSWMIQFMQANQESSAFFRCIQIVIPGTEIPRWFNYQSKGDSISIDPSPFIHDSNNIIAMAFCVAFHARRALCYNTSSAVINLWFGNGNLTDSSLLSIPINIRIIPSKKSADNIWIAYLSQEPLFDLMAHFENAVGNLFQMEVGVDGHKEYLYQIRSCGYQWVCEQDLQHLNVAMIQGENSR